MSRRTRTAVAAAGTLVLTLVALAIFVLPFAFPTPPPIITRFHATQFFSPDGDGRRDVARISVRVRDPSSVVVEVRHEDELVRTLVDRERVAPGWLRVSWDGRDAEGRVVPDGAYALKLRARSGRKQFNTTRRIVVRVAEPTIRRMDVVSLALEPPAERAGRGECRLQVVPGNDGTLAIEIRRRGEADALRRVGPRPAIAGTPVTWTWDGRAEGSPVEPGIHLVTAVLTDTPGNRTQRSATCWAGHLAGTVVTEGAEGRRLGADLAALPDRPLPPDTPVTLRLHRRLGTPGRDEGPVLGRPVGAEVRGRAGGARVPLPRGADPSVLWLVAETADGAALIDPATP